MIAKTLMVFFLLCAYLKAECSPGCLSCINETCNLCDMSRFYFNDGSGTCIENKMENCIVPSLNFASRECHQCAKGYFLDQSILQCSKVPEDINDELCLHYGINLDCLQCEPKFMVVNGLCKAVNSEIPNCIVQFNDTTCSVCDDGSYLNVSGTSCVSFEIEENCQIHQEFKCVQCQDEFHLSLNKTLLNNMSETFLHMKLSMNGLYTTRADHPIEKCSPKFDENCVIYNSYGKCQECVPNYFVEKVSGKCQLNKQSPILNCGVYSDGSTCEECIFGFFLSNNSCHLRTKTIENCEVLSTDAEGCSTCKKRYYSLNGECTLRNNSYQIEFCDEYDNEADKCTNCLYNMILSTDGLKCFQPIQFCNQHVNTTHNSELKCSSCDSNSIPLPDAVETTECELRNNPNCVSYETDNDVKCSECALGHYLTDEFECEKHTKKCKKYSPDSDSCLLCYEWQYKTAENECENLSVFNCATFVPNENKCETCHPNHYIDSDSFECVPYNLINCQTPSESENVCDSCKAGHYSSDSVTCLPYDLSGCVKISPTENACLDETDNCVDGFYFDSESSLCLPHALVGCTNMSKTAPSTCSACEDGYFVSDGKCSPYTVQNCDTYEENSNQCQSTGCIDGYYFSNGLCLPIPISWCNEADTNGICTECQSGYFVSDSVCVLQFSEGCKSYSNLTSNDCSDCNPGYALNGTICEKKEILFCKSINTLTGVCSSCQDGYQVNTAGDACFPKTQLNCSTYNSDGICTLLSDNDSYDINGSETKIANYIGCKIPDGENDNCSTCMDGYHNSSGTCIKNNIENCLEYSSDGTCSLCVSLYYGDNCDAITSLNNCNRSNGVNDVCVACKPNYYVDGSDCSATTKVNTDYCLENETTDDTKSCTKCLNGYVMISEYRTTQENPVYCKDYNADNDICNKLDEGWEFVNSEYVLASLDSACIQLKAGSEDAIDASDSCEKCRNYETHYLNNNNCSERVNSKNRCSIYTKDSDTCVACIEGLEYNTTANTNNDCTEAMKTISNTENCKKTLAGGLGCYQCDDDYYVNSTNSNFCENTEDLPNCRIYDGSNCTNCIDGYLLDDTNNCVRDNCLLWSDDNSYCNVCKEGYYPTDNSNTNKICLPKLFEDECKYVGVHESSIFCFQCKNEYQIPIHHEFSSFFNTRYKCIDEPKFFENHFISSDGKVKNISNEKVNGVFIPKYYQYMESQKEFGGFTTSNVEGNIDNYCIDISIENCQTHGSNVLFNYCTKCKSGYYMEYINSKQYCTKGGINGCDIYSNSTTCSKCLNGFVKNSNACDEIPKIPYCEIYHPSNTECVQCLDGYILMNKECQEFKNYNCSFFSFPLNRCIMCNKGYYSKGGSCKPRNISNCEIFSPIYNLCHTCVENYYLTDDAICDKNTTENCEHKSRVSDTCLLCENGFYRDSTTGKCIRWLLPNCQVGHPEEPNCLGCKDGYYLSHGQCVKHTVTNCVQFKAKSNQCLLCQNGYYLNSVGFCLKRDVKNCLKVHPNKNMCIECERGFYTGSNKQCVKHSVSNCFIYSPLENKCLSCLSGFYKDANGDCVSYTSIRNCVNIDPHQDKCLDCIPGFFITGRECVQYTVNNCDIYKPDADLCVSCLPGYFLMDNHCVSSTLNCATYNLYKNECFTCKEGDFIKDNICQPNTASFCIEKSTISNTCLSCPKEFYLEEGRCILRSKSKNCAVAMRTADLCDSCPKTHYLAENLCIAYTRELCATYNEQKDLCTSCIEGKAWLSHGICEEYTVKHCEEYEPMADKCVRCKQGDYFLADDQTCKMNTRIENCKIYRNDVDECKTCYEGYYLLDGETCIPNPDGLYKCVAYLNEEVCLECEPGFYIQYGNCQRSSTSISNCKKYSDDAVCEICDSNYLRIEYVESTGDEEQVETDDGIIFSGLKIPEFICKEVQENSCLTWTDVSNCKTCSENQVLKEHEENKNMICEDSGLENCKIAEYNADGNVCIECSIGYLLKETEDGSKACLTPENLIDGCVDYEDEGVCITCEENKTLAASKTGCIESHPFMSAHCKVGAELIKPACQVCKEGYQMNEDGVCVQCGGEGCAVCDPFDDQLCLVCLPSYEHLNGLCQSVADTEVMDSESEKYTIGSGIMIYDLFAFLMIVISLLKA